MSTIKDGDTVKVHYTGTLEDGEVFDSSLNRDPLQFTLGQGQLIPGFEKAIIGFSLLVRVNLSRDLKKQLLVFHSWSGSTYPGI